MRLPNIRDVVFYLKAIVFSPLIIIYFIYYVISLNIRARRHRKKADDIRREKGNEPLPRVASPNGLRP